MTTPGLGLNSLDIILIVLAGILIFRGLLRGIVREVLSVFSLIIGLFLATKYHTILAPYYERVFDGPGAVKAFSYLTIIIATLAVAFIIGAIIKKILTVSMLTWADQVLGGLLGLVEAVLVGGILIIVLHSFAPNSEFLNKSKLAPKVMATATFVIDMAPDEILESLDYKSLIPENSELTNKMKGTFTDE